MEDNSRPRSHSVIQTRTPGIQLRATRFLKKVTNLRVRTSRPSKEARGSDAEYTRQASSIDMTQKPFASQSTSTFQVPDSQDETGYSSRSASHDSHCGSKRLSAREVGGQASMNHSSPVLRPQSAHEAVLVQNGWLLVPKIPQSGQDAAWTGQSRPNDRRSREVVPYPNIDKRRPPLPPPNVSSDKHVPSTSPRASMVEHHPVAPAHSKIVEGQSLKRLSSIHGHSTNTASRHKRASSSGVKDVSEKSTSRDQVPPMPTTSPPRQSTPIISNMPPPSLIRAGSTRLSPSLVMRHLPMPILNLPTLPVPTPSPSMRIPSRTRLRSMPALPAEGPGDNEPADHENAGLGDSDDEDNADLDDSSETHTDAGHTGGSGVRDSSDSTSSSRSSTRSPTPFLRGPLALPAVDTSPLDFSFLDHSFGVNTEKPRGRATDETPTTRHPSDYFSFRPSGRGSPSLSPTRTLRPGDVQRTPFATAFRQAHIKVPSTELSPSTSRGPMYRLPSKSMITLSLIPKNEEIPHPVAPDGEKTIGAPAGKGKARESSKVAAASLPEPGSVELPVKITEASVGGLSSPLRKMRSMPIFNVSSAPPPYPSFTLHQLPKGPTVMPREEEGMEKLPPYSNAIHLSAIMPRKMEFIAPGVQARDRKWRRVLCVLEGTVLKIYQCPRSAAGVGLLENWWEKTVGVGDISALPNTGPVGSQTSVEKAIRASGKQDLMADSNAPWTSHTPFPESIARPTSAPTTARDNGLSRHTKPSPLMTLSQPSSTSTSRSNLSSGSRLTDVTGVEIPKCSLIHAYTMQYAESGLGNDYLKRKNVIRLRLEGQQFLLQAVNVAAVVEWIEAFQAAGNISLDLDVRPMPKGPIFPRRRRRRTHREVATTT